MEVEPNTFYVFGMWAPAALLAGSGLALGVLRDRGGSKPAMTRALQVVAGIAAVVLASALLFVSVAAYVHDRAERDARQSGQDR